jgi:hypothetical protein
MSSSIKFDLCKYMYALHTQEVCADLWLNGKKWNVMINVYFKTYKGWLANVLVCKCVGEKLFAFCRELGEYASIFWIIYISILGDGFLFHTHIFHQDDGDCVLPHACKTYLF